MSNIILDTMWAKVRIRISRESAHSLANRNHPAISRTFFTHATLISEQTSNELIVVEYNRRSHGEKSLLFRDFGTHLVCCNRLEAIDGEGLADITEQLFSVHRAAFIVFEDIVAEDDTYAHKPHFSFSYQENWCRNIDAGEKYLSKRRRSVLRRRLKKLREAYPDDALRFEFERAKDADIDAVVAMNAATLSAQGRRQDFPEERQKQFKKLAGKIGYSAKLFVGNRFIAGDVLCVIGSEAWFNIGSYDLEFREYSPGMQLHSFIIDECLKLGVRKVNFLWGDSPWKADVGARRTPLTTIFFARDKRDFTTIHFLRQAFPHVKQMARRRLGSIVRRLRRTK